MHLCTFLNKQVPMYAYTTCAGVAPEKLKRTPSLSALDELVMGRDSDQQQQCFVFMLKVSAAAAALLAGVLYIYSFMQTQVNALAVEQSSFLCQQLLSPACRCLPGRLAAGLLAAADCARWVPKPRGLGLVTPQTAEANSQAHQLLHVLWVTHCCWCVRGADAGWRELPSVRLLLVCARDAAQAPQPGAAAVPQLQGTIQAVHDCSTSLLLPAVSLPLL
jgi:hypothetical protein